MEITVGIDWSEKHHDVCILNDAGVPLSSFQFKHSPDGFERFLKEVSLLGLDASACPVALETAHTMLVDFLWSQGYPVYVVPPFMVKGNRSRYRFSGARNDASDAMLLADILRTDRGRLVTWKPDSSLLFQMRAKVSFVNSLTCSIIRNANQLRAVLLRCYPQALQTFSDLTAQISLRFLMAYPTAETARSLDYSQFEAFCKQHQYSQALRIKSAYMRLQAPSLRADSAIVHGYRDQIPFMAEVLLHLVRRKRQELVALKKLFVQHPDHHIFASLPGVGDLLAPGLLVKFGEDRGRFPAANAVQALAGTCPVTSASGQKRAVWFRRACDREFRHIAQQFARSSTKQSAWAAAYWSAARKRGHSISHAHRCLANRWLEIIWKIWQTRELYDEAYHLQQRALHSKPQLTA